MKNIFRIMLVASLVLQTACVGLAKRPKGLPPDASLAGGIKGGSWLKCNNDGDLLHCEIFNYAGRFFEAGIFEPADSIPTCYPSFIITDYRFDKKALVPMKVKRFNGGGYILKRSKSETIEATINNGYRDTQNLEIRNMVTKYNDECYNGSYTANLPNGNEVAARIWAGEFVEILIAK